MDFRRQVGILNPKELVIPVHIIGLGGIGSAIAPVLVKLGFRQFTLWDDDSVEHVNLNTQLAYREKDVGVPKADALREILLSYRSVDVIAHTQRFPIYSDDADEKSADIAGIIISGVDSMQSRIDIWHTIRYNPFVHLYLDGRIGGENLELYTVRPTALEDSEFYEQFLFPDEDASSQACGEESIIGPAVILAGLMENQIVRWHRKERYDRKLSLMLKPMIFQNTDSTKEKGGDNNG